VTSMSVRRRPDTAKWEVRWREGGRRFSRSFDRKGDADIFAAREKRRIELGGPGPEVGRQSVDEFVEEWYRHHAIPNLEPSTRAVYSLMWANHARARVGHLELRGLTPKVAAKLRSDLERAGVGDPTIIKTMTMLQSVMTLAVTWDLVGSNPFAAVRKPRQRRTREVEPIPPEVIEELRARLLGRGRHRDATMISVLAYAGLRPGELLALTWGDVGRTLQVYAPKTRQERFVRILGPLAQDLAEWRIAEGRPNERTPVFRRGSDGGPFKVTDYRNWRRRVYAPLVLRREIAQAGAKLPKPLAKLDDEEVFKAAKALDLQQPRPYDLRGSFVSLLVWEGRNILEVAQQAGHSPQTCLRDYAKILAEDNPATRISAEERIRRAREGLHRGAGEQDRKPRGARSIRSLTGKKSPD